MLDLVINKVMTHLETFYKEYNIQFKVQYNSDLDMLTQYSRSLDTRSLFGKSDLSLISQSDLETLQKDSNILLMYNYSPLKRVEDKFNNINFEAVFDPRNPNGIQEMSKFSKAEKVDGSDSVEFLEVIRERNNQDVSGDTPTDSTIRDMVYAEIEFTCKFLCDSSRIMNDLQFLHIQKLQRQRSLEMSFDFGGDIGKVDFPYNVEFQPIDTIGHIDYNQYGNLQELTFTYKIQGPFFSSYSTKFPMIEAIDLEIGFTNI